MFETAPTLPNPHNPHNRHKPHKPLQVPPRISLPRHLPQNPPLLPNLLGRDFILGGIGANEQGGERHAPNDGVRKRDGDVGGAEE